MQPKPSSGRHCVGARCFSIRSNGHPFLKDARACHDLQSSSRGSPATLIHARLSRRSECSPDAEQLLTGLGLSTTQAECRGNDDEPKNIFDDARRWMYLHIMSQTQKTLTAYQPALPCACATLRRATRAVTQIYNAALRETGLEITQFTFLQFLALAGETTQADMAQARAIDSSTLTRSIKPLQAEGWIAGRTGTDRRERLLPLTPVGRKALDP